ncbi:MAG: hypothetical protein F9K48_03340 [Candidatus Brocadia sp.]|nr:MAG: hypothetical protein F9K48_03340 [Candidatus Brocadia sp.]
MREKDITSDKAQHTTSKPKSGQWNYEKFNKWAGGIQSCFAILGMVLAGVWTLIKYDKLLEAKIAAAQAEKIEYETVAAKRNAVPSRVVNIDLIAQKLELSQGDDRWIVVELTIKNTGNEPFSLDLSKYEFYIAKVLSIDCEGIVKYDCRINLKFGYPDKTLDWFMLRPGAEGDRYSAIQKVSSPGLYIARFSVAVPDSKIAKDHEYNAQTFFLVN